MPNAYESGEQKNIPAVLVYVESDGKFLMLHRNAGERGVEARKADFHAGKWNGLGGKCELGEAMIDAAVREVREESGLELAASELRFLGFLQFPNFKPHRREDWSVGVFLASLDSLRAARALKESEEGELHWISKSDVMSLNLWPADRSFLPYVLEETPFFGAIAYEAGEPKRVEIRAIGLGSASAVGLFR